MLLLTLHVNTVHSCAGPANTESVLRYHNTGTNRSRHHPVQHRRSSEGWFESCWTPEGAGQGEANLPPHGRHPRGKCTAPAESPPTDSKEHVLVRRGVAHDLPARVHPERTVHVHQMPPIGAEGAANGRAVPGWCPRVAAVIDTIQIRHPQHGD